MPKFKEVYPSQNPFEFENLCTLVRAMKPEVILEIGSRTGLSFLRFVESAQPSLKSAISIDLPGSKWGWKGTGLILRNRIAELETRFPKTQFELCLASSRSSQAREVLKGFMGEIDFIFIDGDHRYAGVRSDWELALEFGRKGALVGFHDIAGGNHNNTGGVTKLWSEIRDYHVEQFVCKKHKKMGIGVAQIK